jgi:hypothetical protein
VKKASRSRWDSIRRWLLLALIIPLGYLVILIIMTLVEPHGWYQLVVAPQVNGTTYLYRGGGPYAKFSDCQKATISKEAGQTFVGTCVWMWYFQARKLQAFDSSKAR